jgi:hypothetical protein
VSKFELFNTENNFNVLSVTPTHPEAAIVVRFLIPLSAKKIIKVKL